MEQEMRYDDRHAEVLEMLRSDLIGELEAINQYERHARMSAHPPARQLFHEIANDERHHVAELLKMIAELDPRQAQELRRVFY
ncbi:demethoxyubiquinone hydroxylase family protein [Thermoanaerobacterium sp. DL9XJH110]|uniref:demethoxyubiquinone hydroxylase family protein n=1 Tax=Thermoanaerobacterium sp. DL9XJH110 TaxID=3386643 RepID=UPI003BB50DE3